VRLPAAEPGQRDRYLVVQTDGYVAMHTDRGLAAQPKPRYVPSRFGVFFDVAMKSIAEEAQPNPATAGTIPEFITAMRQLKAWAGDLSLRHLEKRAGCGRLPRSSVSDALRRTDRLPEIDLVTEFVKACGAENSLPVWHTTWYRLRAAEVAARS
jgi:hypothetical protein